MVDKWTPTSPVETLGFNMQDAARLSRRYFDRTLHEDGLDLTQVQWRSLGIVWKRPGISQVALADILEIAPISVGRLIDRMEEAGWMERRPDPNDRRALQLFVTDKAEPTLKTIKATADKVRNEITKGISKADLEVASNVMATIRANLIALDGESK